MGVFDKSDNHPSNFREDSVALDVDHIAFKPDVLQPRSSTAANAILPQCTISGAESMNVSLDASVSIYDKAQTTRDKSASATDEQSLPKYFEIPKAKIELWATAIAEMAENRPSNYDELRTILEVAGRRGGPVALHAIESATHDKLRGTTHRFAIWQRDGEHYAAGFFSSDGKNRTGTRFSIAPEVAAQWNYDNERAKQYIITYEADGKTIKEISGPDLPNGRIHSDGGKTPITIRSSNGCIEQRVSEYTIRTYSSIALAHTDTFRTQDGREYKVGLMPDNKTITSITGPGISMDYANGTKPISIDPISGAISQRNGDTDSGVYEPKIFRRKPPIDSAIEETGDHIRRFSMGALILTMPNGDIFVRDGNETSFTPAPTTRAKVESDERGTTITYSNGDSVQFQISTSEFTINRAAGRFKLVEDNTGRYRAKEV